MSDNPYVSPDAVSAPDAMESEGERAPVPPGRPLSGILALFGFAVIAAPVLVARGIWLTYAPMVEESTRRRAA